MAVEKWGNRIKELQATLRECDARFALEARKRGFDPSQAQNMAMPAPLAKLFTECEAIKAELEELAENQEGGELDRNAK